MNHIELFAGCGGLTLGLESMGFHLVFANELSIMAGETFAYNFFQEDLSQKATTSAPFKTKWLASQYPRAEMSKRLREDPRTYPAQEQAYSDIADISSLDGSLLIGNIIQLNNWLEQHQAAIPLLRNSFGRGELDLVSGGPPCQSFSMAGMRQFSNARNSLPWEFAKFVQQTQPKIALLENVSGILKPFTIAGKSYYAWFEVAKAFAKVGYIPLCLHINAKYVGVAQNRPRFIMLALRHDIYTALKKSFTPIEIDMFSKAENFYAKMAKADVVGYGELDYFDIEKLPQRKYFEQSFLSPLFTERQGFRTVQDAIDDLRVNVAEAVKPSSYPQAINQLFENNLAASALANHELRNNNALVKARFRIYQILNQVDRTTLKAAKQLLKGEISALPFTSAEALLPFAYLDADNQDVYWKSKAELEHYLLKHQTKKQTQKALIADSPAPAAMSIADDMCHYHPDELRTLTVREMARIQSFPDQFVFRSKITTGGKMRQFEVPQYTQVGNAVPPLLGRALGAAVKGLLERLATSRLSTQNPPNPAHICGIIA